MARVRKTTSSAKKAPSAGRGKQRELEALLATEPCELDLGRELDRSLVELLSRRARKVRMLGCETGGSLGSLAMPGLEFLELSMTQAIDVATLAPLFAAGDVPALRRLDFIRMGGKPLTSAFLDALVASKMLRQLEWLAFRQEALSDAGVARLLERRAALAHLRGVFIDSSVPDLAKQVAQVFGVQHETRRMTGKHAGKMLAIGSYQTWPSPSQQPSITNADADDLERLRHGPADAIEAYWRAKVREDE
jgi:hypothetical protein